jgi:hypothetical protein
MWRWTSKVIFAVFLVGWALAVTIYIRSQFRADVVTIITPWHHCIVIACVDHQLEMTSLSHWPGRRQFQWTTGGVEFDSLNPNAIDTLQGPDLPWNDWPTLPATNWNWRRFSVNREDDFITVPTSIDHPWRNWDFGGIAMPVVKVKTTIASAPVWSLPLAFTVFLAGTMVPFVRHRLQKRRRRLRGLCVQCGYDLRQSPGRCPECGSPC